MELERERVKLFLNFNKEFLPKESLKASKRTFKFVKIGREELDLMNQVIINTLQFQRSN
jgi:hypothetical protein